MFRRACTPVHPIYQSQDQCHPREDRLMPRAAECRWQWQWRWGNSVRLRKRRRTDSCFCQRRCPAKCSDDQTHWHNYYRCCSVRTLPGEILDMSHSISWWWLRVHWIEAPRMLYPVKLDRQHVGSYVWCLGIFYRQGGELLLKWKLQVWYRGPDHQHTASIT